MKNRFFRVFLIIVITSLIFIRYTAWETLQEEAVREKYDITLKEVKKLYPEAESFNLTMLDKEGAAVYDADGRIIGRFLCTSPASDDIKGYGGSVPLLVGMDQGMRITRVTFLPNQESRRFTRKLQDSGFLDIWNGVTVREAIEKEVDTVTGATLTSSAVIDFLKKRLALFIQEEAVIGAVGVRWKITDILVFLVLSLALFNFFFPPALGRYRWALLLLNVSVLGFLAGYLLSVNLFFSWLLGGIAWRVYPLLVLVAVFSITLPLITGRNFYCGYLCPYGCLQELVGMASRTKLHISDYASGILKKARRVFLTIIVIVLLLGVDFNLNYIEPFSAFQLSFAAPFVLMLAAVFLIVSIFVPRFWCNYLCPTGQIIEFLQKKG